MSKPSHVDPSNAYSNALDSKTPALQERHWRALAEHRLTRLVEIEHDHSVMLDRLALLQIDYLEVVVASEDRLVKIGELGKEGARLETRLIQLESEHRSMHEAFESIRQSRSWRVTRPMRSVSGWLGSRHRVGSIVRHLLRVPLVRRSARFVVRMVPGLHERIRDRLYGPDRRKKST